MAECEHGVRRYSNSGPHIKATCAKCGRFLGFVRQPAAGFVMPIGKYRGNCLRDIPREYLKWCAKNLSSDNIRERIQEYLDEPGE